jgi:hypothetical protein
MDKYVKAALVANAATLGFHWIYNSNYLEELSKKQSLLFQKQSKKHFDKAKPSYFVYPKAKHTTQGMMLKWLYENMIDHLEFSKTDYENLIYDYFKPGGNYHGYVETYGKRLVLNKLANELKIQIPHEALIDDHLVGFIPYLVTKELGLGLDKAWELASVFTDEKAYPAFYRMFDYIFMNIQKLSKKELYEKAISFAPDDYQKTLYAAIHLKDTKSFINQYAGIACHLPQSIPLIFHMLYFGNSYEEVIDWNAKLGGASSDRGLLLGAIMSQISPIPKDWLNKI